MSRVSAQDGTTFETVAGRAGGNLWFVYREQPQPMGDVQYVKLGTYDVTYIVPAEETYQLDVALGHGGLTAEYFSNRWLICP